MLFKDYVQKELKYGIMTACFIYEEDEDGIKQKVLLLVNDEFDFHEIDQSSGSFMTAKYGKVRLARHNTGVYSEENWQGPKRHMERLYGYPQETWDEKTCKKWANYAPKDHWGNKPPKGLIANEGSSSPEYGQTCKYNGGCTHDERWYHGEYRPLPLIHESYEFHYLSSWGITIRKKQP